MFFSSIISEAQLCLAYGNIKSRRLQINADGCFQRCMEMWNQSSREAAGSKATCASGRSLKSLQTLTQATISWIWLSCICIPEVQISLRALRLSDPAHLWHKQRRFARLFIDSFIYLLRPVQKYSIQTEMIHENSQVSGCWCRQVEVNQLPDRDRDPHLRVAESSAPESCRESPKTIF